MSASWSTLPTCTPNTRVSVLRDVDTWVETRNGPCVFWLNGLAGTGKSTVAATACERLEERHLLGASFMVDRQQADCRDASKIVHTIAHELALRNHVIAKALCAKLRSSSASLSATLEKQVSELIVEPARELDDQSTLVIVIDALDECFLDARRRPGGNLLLVLVRQLLSLSGRLKLLITSRNDLSIQQMFKQLSAIANQQVVTLHDLDDAMVHSDIRSYLVQSFDVIREDRSGELSLSGWPNNKDLDRLVHLSGGLFIYAATAVRFLSSHHHSPADRLVQLLDHKKTSDSPSRYDRLTELYTQILKDAVLSSPGTIDLAFCERLHAVLAVIVLAQTPVRVDALAVLSGVKLNDVRIILRCLTSLLADTNEEPVCIFHPSFPDFMMDASRCPFDSLCVTPHIDQSILAFHCLAILNQTLHYDICEIRDPAISNNEVPYLSGRLEEKIPKWNAVRYASCFWSTHLVQCNKPTGNLLDALADFCCKHLFHWLEVLSLMEHLSLVEGELLKVIEWCKV
jgi:hypothetical protein